MTDDQVTAQGLAAIVTSAFERGLEPDAAEQEALHWWRALGSPTGAFAAAATEIGRQPQPVQVPDSEEAIRVALGGSSVADQLIAALRARETLEGLARQQG